MDSPTALIPERQHVRWVEDWFDGRRPDKEGSSYALGVTHN